ncbi:hypothetical protein CCACVL1_25122 [Corchorus capsularis]|uniref:SHSP domain-containing protein n=1 Tax=Corchorus capsularis TaxID=210143 RepID=A0A1R3GLX5_COCAP|nr:hypothetical protein CCACVL1_25122 [Corchorus capsularis]
MARSPPYRPSYSSSESERSVSGERSLSRSHSPIRRRSRSRSPLEVDEEWGVMNVKLSSAWSWSSSRDLLRTDWKETATKYVFKADVPGLTAEDLTVEVEDGRLLNLRGEKRVSSRDNSTTSSETINRHTERKSGRFARRFLLRHNIDVAAVKAEMERGVLTVTLPKAGKKIIAIPLSLVN